MIRGAPHDVQHPIETIESATSRACLKTSMISLYLRLCRYLQVCVLGGGGWWCLILVYSILAYD